MENQTIINQALLAGTEALERAGIENPKIEARMLVGLAINGGPEKVVAHGNRQMTQSEYVAFLSALKRRCSNEPMAYITGTREFWSLPFIVTPSTLIPRPDSETLVEAILGHIIDKTNTIRILDLGTGSGCLLLALLSELTNASGVGIDASSDALKVASMNANALGLSGRTKFINSDWNDAGWTNELNEKFHIVVSNPPYISNSEITLLDSTVREHEPLLALGGGVDGLDSYRAIIATLDKLLLDGAMVAFEVGHSQSSDVSQILSQNMLEVIEIKEDLSGIARAVLARKIKS